jgi:hypothetical protein
MARANVGDVGKVEGAAQQLALFLFPDAHDNYVHRLAKLWEDCIQENRPRHVDVSQKISFRPVSFCIIYSYRRRTRVRCTQMNKLAHQTTSSEGAYLNGKWTNLVVRNDSRYTANSGFFPQLFTLAPAEE